MAPEARAADNFDAAFKRAQDARMEGRYDEAGKIYLSMTESEDLREQAIGYQHRGIVMRNRSWQAKDEGDEERTRQLLEKSIADSEEASQLYRKLGLFAEESDARLNKALAYRECGDLDKSEQEIRESLSRLQSHRGEVDEAKINSHVANKHARLASVLLDKGDIEGAKTALSRAEGYSQSNDYSAMRKDQIGGDVYRTAGDTVMARAYYEKALPVAERYNEKRRIEAIRTALDDLTS